MKHADILLGICLLLPLPALGDAIYRCDGADGVPRFQSYPCPGGEAVELPPPAARWEALRPGERALLQQARRRERTARSTRPPRRSRKEHASARTCLARRQRVEALSAQLRRGYKPARGERLRRRRDNLAEFIRRFCD